MNRPLTIYLPRVDEPDSSGDREKKRREEICRTVAAYAAAMVINLEFILGPQALELDYFSDPARGFWDPWIQRALRDNGIRGVQRYLEQFHADCCTTRSTDVVDAVRIRKEFPRTYRLPAPSRVLGIDVGGSEIKCALFEVKARRRGKLQTLELGAALEPVKMPTAPRGSLSTRPPYRNARALARRVITELEVAGWRLQGLLAVGVAWPGAVRDGSIAAASGILDRFHGFKHWRKGVDPGKLHRLDVLQGFRQELRTRFSTDDGPILALLNDGDADIKATEDQARDAPADEVSLILKAGTGTACGIYIGPRQIELLAEAGKMVINLRRSNPRFPAGTLNEHCSKKTLPAIASALGWDPQRQVGINAREIGYFLERRDSRGAADLADRIGPDRLEKVAAAVPSGQDPGELAPLCANIAGRQLGDAIALLVAVFRSREIRLGGGALSAATGTQVARAARHALKEVYGFEVTFRPSTGRSKLDAHALSEVRKIRVLGPARRRRKLSAPPGALGAARAALELFAHDVKGRALREVRSELNDLYWDTEGRSAARVVRPEALIRPGSPLTLQEVIELLEAFMATLGITREPSGSYFKFDRGRGAQAEAGAAGPESEKAR